MATEPRLRVPIELVHSYNFAFGDGKRRDEAFDKIVAYINCNMPNFPVAVVEYESLLGAKYGMMVMVLFLGDPLEPEIDDYFCRLVAQLRLGSDHCGVDEHTCSDVIPYGRVFPRQG